VTFPKRGLVAAELAALAVIVAAHVVLLTVLLHTRTTFDEGVYLLSLDELRHGQALGREVFTSQGPVFYMLLQAPSAASGSASSRSTRSAQSSPSCSDAGSPARSAGSPARG
jgi:hypothetical protein